MVFGAIRYKIWYDLWENKGRTLRVVAIIAIGAFAVGTVLGGKEFILSDMARNWQASNPATIGLFVSPAVDDTMIDTLENLRGIETVIGWQQETITWRPDPGSAWEPAILVALDDYEDQSIRKVTLDSGDWPHRKLMGVQRGRGLAIGDQVQIEIDDKAETIEFNGIVYNAAHPPPFVVPDPMFFTTQERFTQLTGEKNYSLVLATIPNYSKERVVAAADLIQHELEKQDIEVRAAIPAPGGFVTRTSHPDRFIAQDALDGVFLILTIMSVATFILGLFLVYNTINAVITQQINQIGIMKAVGARYGEIILVYMVIVLVYAVMALLVAVPLGALGSNGLRYGMIGRIQMTPGPFTLSTTAVTVQVVIALLSPLVIAIVPIMTGARITVREAVSTYGLGGASGVLDRLLAQLQFIPRILALTVSNTFRNKKRVAFTQITLVGAGVIFMVVVSTRGSLLYTFSDILFSIFDVNIMLDLKDEERIEKIEAVSLSLPDVEEVEVWGMSRGKARIEGQPEANDDIEINLRGLPLPTNAYLPQLRAGRWLEPDDTYAMVLNQAAAIEMGVDVGDWITVDIPTKRESNWQIVGLVFEPLDQESAIVPRDTLLREIRQVGRGTAIRVKTIQSDADSELNAAVALRELYENNGFDVIASRMDTTHRITELRVEQISILMALLSGMAIMIAAVGAVALSGTLSINVLERTREIGVMRAIGASAAAILSQFIGEGLLLGWLSWLIAIPLSVPVGQLIISALSQLLNTELIYRFSEAGVLYWFAIVTVLAAIASWFPASKAAQTSVRESLMYS
ncbi:MAG: FtsX-like permease family protein [Anaerolineae bacterium]|nr:FtsX-like permease family protein [Anaerolineae bacterium]